jgi:hypothetical protein
MGLMDKVKAQATQLAQQTKEAAEQGKAKLDQAQAGRRGDAMLRQLGVAVFADRTGRGTPDSQAKIDQLINDISAFERENGLNLADPSSGASVPQQPVFPPDPASPFPGGQQNAYPGGAPAGGTSSGFPDAGPTAFPDANTGFPPSGQNFFPPSGDAGSPPESGGVSGFPPES